MFYFYEICILHFIMLKEHSYELSLFIIITVHIHIYIQIDKMYLCCIDILLLLIIVNYYLRKNVYFKIKTIDYFLL